jgi:hypothetical protein
VLAECGYRYKKPAQATEAAAKQILPKGDAPASTATAAAAGRRYTGNVEALFKDTSNKIGLSRYACRHCVYPLSICSSQCEYNCV